MTATIIWACLFLGSAIILFWRLSFWAQQASFVSDDVLDQYIRRQSSRFRFFASRNRIFRNDDSLTSSRVSERILSSLHSFLIAADTRVMNRLREMRKRPLEIKDLSKEPIISPIKKQGNKETEMLAKSPMYWQKIKNKK